MFPPPKDQIDITAPEFETTPLVKPTGFREYDARWLFPQEINLMGIQALGFGLAMFSMTCWVPTKSRPLLSGMIIALIRNR